MYFLINLLSFLVCLYYLFFSVCLILCLIILSCFFFRFPLYYFKLPLTNASFTFKGPVSTLFWQCIQTGCKLWGLFWTRCVGSVVLVDTADFLVQSLSTSCSCRLHSYVFLHIHMSWVHYGDTWPWLAVCNIGKNAKLWIFFFCHENMAIAYASLLMSTPW